VPKLLQTKLTFKNLIGFLYSSRRFPTQF